MRAVAYLSHALAIRQGATATPNQATCVVGRGHPGAVYICPTTVSNPQDCKWLDYSQTKTCLVIDTIGMKLPSFIGPDFGGHCHVYTSATCNDGTEVAFEQSTAAKKTKLVCPGVAIGKEMAGLEKAVALKCFDSMEHPAM